MKILQVSNFVSHHQLPLARQLVNIIGENNFKFCAVENLDIDRIKLGWNEHYSESWILYSGKSEADRRQYEYWWDNADIVICGQRNFDRMFDRLSKGKIVFYMSERWWKQPLGMTRLLHPKFLKMALCFQKISKYSSFHYLPIGPYAKNDISLFRNLKNKIWNWGYFTDIPILSASNSVQASKLVKILWVGRMLRMKEVHILIKALAELKKRHVLFELTLVGDGPELLYLKKLVSTLLDGKNCYFHNSMSATRILEIMKQNDIYVFPSNANEGWGAVVNEAMGCGCVVVASRAAGAAAAMIEYGVNGLLFNAGDWQGLADKLFILINNIDLRKKISASATCTITNIWSPSVAAERFYNVCLALLKNHTVPIYKNGPMSRKEF